MKHISHLIVAISFTLLIVARANASIVSGTGSPTYTNGWPEGAVAVSNLKSCVGWWEGPPFGGGEWHIQFRGDAEAFKEALKNFAAIKSPALDLVIHDGVKNDQFLKTNVDWEFVVWVPENWNRLYNSTNDALAKIFKDSPVASNLGKPVPAPLLNIYIGGVVDFSKIIIPVNLHVRDERSKK